MGMLLNVWTDFTDWISNDWSDTTFFFIMSVFLVLGLMALLTFIKKSYNNNKSDKIKWSMLVLSILMFAIVAVLCVAKFA